MRLEATAARDWTAAFAKLPRCRWRTTRHARSSRRTPARTRPATSISASGLIALAIAKTRNVASLR
jgi:hypothetical protein